MKAHISTSGQLGPVLKNLRLKKGLSQEELGSRIGLSQERISKIENHPEKVTLDQILTLLMALDAALLVQSRTSLEATVTHDDTGGKMPTYSKDTW